MKKIKPSVLFMYALIIVAVSVIMFSFVKPLLNKKGNISAPEKQY